MFKKIGFILLSSFLAVVLTSCEDVSVAEISVKVTDSGAAVKNTRVDISLSSIQPYDLDLYDAVDFWQTRANPKQNEDENKNMDTCTKTDDAGVAKCRVRTQAYGVKLYNYNVSVTVGSKKGGGIINVQRDTEIEIEIK